MKNVIIVFAAVFFSALIFHKSAAQDLPPEVVKAYQGYSAALKNKDYKAALSYAKTAWEEAEKQKGDTKTTGDLAFNYGFWASRLGKYEDAKKPLIRSAELSVLDPENGAVSRMEREAKLSGILMAVGEQRTMKKRMHDALQFAEKNDLEDNIYTAELLVNMARYYSTKANVAAERSPPIYSQHSANMVKMRTRKIQSQSADYAQTALQIYDKYPERREIEANYIAMAHKLIGFAYERDKEWKEAMLAYQRAMEIQKEYSTLDDPSYVTLIGRWINTRSLFMYKKTLEEAYAEGMCKCWPYDKEEKITAEPVKQVSPIMPRKARTSGFSIIRFDLSDNGDVINEEIVHSWPKKVFDKSSLNAIKRWKFETKADGKLGAQRTGIVKTIQYILVDYNSKAPI